MYLKYLPDLASLQMENFVSNIFIIFLNNLAGIGNLKVQFLTDTFNKKFVVVGAVGRLGIHELLLLASGINPLTVGLQFVKIPDIFVFRDLELCFSPEGGNIGSVEFDPGNFVLIKMVYI